MSNFAATNLGKEVRPGVWEHEFVQAEDLLQSLHPLSGYWDAARNWIFRGHGDAEWLLLPTAHREEPWEPLNTIHATPFVPALSDEGERAKRERELIQEFFDAVDEAGLSVPDFNTLKLLLDPHPPRLSPYWPSHELVPILALAQHYGLPTRLLDWSRVGRIAAYFAAVRPRKDAAHLAVWALNTAALREVRGSSGRAECIVGTAPRSSNPNLHAQAGLFTYCHWYVEQLSPLNELVSDGLVNFQSATKHRGSLPCVMRKMVLRRDAAQDLMRLLHLDGVSALTMFPGFSGVAKHVQERMWCSAGSRRSGLDG